MHISSSIWRKALYNWGRNIYEKWAHMALQNVEMCYEIPLFLFNNSLIIHSAWPCWPVVNWLFEKACAITAHLLPDIWFSFVGTMLFWVVKRCFPCIKQSFQLAWVIMVRYKFLHFAHDWDSILRRTGSIKSTIHPCSLWTLGLSLSRSNALSGHRQNCVSVYTVYFSVLNWRRYR